MVDSTGRFDIDQADNNQVDNSDQVAHMENKARFDSSKETAVYCVGPKDNRDSCL